MCTTGKSAKSVPPEVRTSGNLYVRQSVPPEIRTSGNPFLRESVNLEIRSSGNPYLWKSIPLEIHASGNPYLRKSVPRKFVHLETPTSENQYLMEIQGSGPEGGVQYFAPTYFVWDRHVVKKIILLRASFFCQYDLACATIKICQCTISNNPTLKIKTINHVLYILI